MTGPTEDTLSGRLRESIAGGATIEEATDRAIHGMTPGELAVIATPLVRDQARRVWRDVMRAREDAIADSHGGSVAAAFTFDHGHVVGDTLCTAAVVDPSGRANRSTKPTAPAPARRVSPDPHVRGLAFLLPNGARVLWAEATAEQHEARAHMQRAYAGAQTRDAERHEEAARIIRSHGVTCLADLTKTADAHEDSTPDRRPRRRTRKPVVTA